MSEIDTQAPQISNGAGAEQATANELDVTTRRGFKLDELAIRQRWPTLPDDRELVRRKASEKLAEVKSPRNIVMLSKVIIAMEGANQRDDHFNVEHNRRLQMDHEQAQKPAPDAPAVNVNVVQQTIVNDRAERFDHDRFADQFDEFAKSGRFGERAAEADGPR